jgi:hypothetical protein
MSDCYLDNGVPNTCKRRIAAVPIQRKRQHTSATIGAGNCYTTHSVGSFSVATELLGMVSPIQAAKTLFKGESAEKR